MKTNIAPINDVRNINSMKNNVEETKEVDENTNIVFIISIYIYITIVYKNTYNNSKITMTNEAS